jgi:integrase
MTMLLSDVAQALHTGVRMASLSKHPNGFWCIAFRYRGQRFLRSLQTNNEAIAKRALAGIEETLQDIGKGRVLVPERCSPDQLWQIVRSGGRLRALPTVLQSKTLQQVIDEYFASYPAGAKSANALITERVQFGHMLRLIGNHKPIYSIDSKTIEQYIVDRQGERGLYGRKLSATTIVKELQSLRQLWNFAEERDYVSGRCPLDRVRKPKAEAQAPFKTWAEIEKQIKREPKMTDADKAAVWSCLFMSEGEITELLQHVKRHAEAMAHPIFAFVAYAGCRRSEMMRAEIDDIDFHSGAIQIREKKKSKSLALTYRRVEMHPKLKDVLKAWLKIHPGTKWLFPNAHGQPLTPKEAVGVFERAVAGSKWQVVEGYHVFRHSFASNCARRAIPQAYIDAWLGHTTEAMQRRYRHLFPTERKAAIAALFA